MSEQGEEIRRLCLENLELSAKVLKLERRIKELACATGLYLLKVERNRSTKKDGEEFMEVLRDAME